MGEIEDLTAIMALVDADGRPTLAALHWFGRLIQALRDLSAENADLKARIEALENP